MTIDSRGYNSRMLDRLGCCMDDNDCFTLLLVVVLFDCVWMNFFGLTFFEMFVLLSKLSLLVCSFSFNMALFACCVSDKPSAVLNNRPQEPLTVMVGFPFVASVCIALADFNVLDVLDVLVDFNVLDVLDTFDVMRLVVFVGRRLVTMGVANFRAAKDCRNTPSFLFVVRRG